MCTNAYQGLAKEVKDSNRQIVQLEEELKELRAKKAVK